MRGRAIVLTLAILAGTVVGVVTAEPAAAQGCYHQASSKTTIIDSWTTAAETFTRMKWYSPNGCYFGPQSWRTWDRNCYSNFFTGYSTLDRGSCNTTAWDFPGGAFGPGGTNTWTTGNFSSGYYGYHAHYQLYSIVTARDNGDTHWYCGRNYLADTQYVNYPPELYQYGVVHCAYHYDY